MRTKKSLTTGFAACAIAMSFGATAALADTITFTANMPDSSTNWSSTLTIPLFNTMLGSLQSIDFALAGDVLGIVSLQNTGSSTANVTATLSSGLHVTGPTAGSSLSTTASGSSSASIGGGGSASLSPSGGSPTTTVHLTAPADLTPFSASGGGTISLGNSATGSCTISGSSNIISQCSTQAGDVLTGTYTYNTVPEPASLTLIGLGLTALGIRARRRRAR